MEILAFLLAPFLASLILTGIHAYLGVHVVERGVIFVDLALAQIAALGATIAILIGLGPHASGAYWLSLGFTFVGAAIFALARTRRGHIPQEAFIGIAYAVASATAILAMSKATGETEHLKDMLVGNILAVSMHDVEKTAKFYIEVFGMKEMGKINSPATTGCFLSDGEINLAILSFKSDEAAGVERGKGFTGIHHIGFEVEDMAAIADKLATAGAARREDVERALGVTGQRKLNVEVKYTGPDGVMVDVSETGWIH